LTSAEEVCLTQEKSRLPAWYWDTNSPYESWGELEKRYIYPFPPPPVASLVHGLPYEPASLFGLRLENLAKERKLIPLAYRWAYTCDHIENRPNLWSTWADSVITGHVEDNILHYPQDGGYIYDVDRINHNKKPLAEKFLDMIFCWEQVLKISDRIDKNLIPKSNRPKAPHVDLYSKTMLDFNFTWKTNIEIKLGLECNYYHLEGKIADYHALHLEFDRDYCEVI
jgi:hypothetical protein